MGEIRDRLLRFGRRDAVFAYADEVAQAQSTNAAPVIIENTTPVDVGKLGTSDDSKKQLADVLAAMKAGTTGSSVFVASANLTSANGLSEPPGTTVSVPDMARVALEDCEFYSKAPCVILAINGHEARDADGNWPTQPRMLEYDPGAPLDVWKLPFVTEYFRAAAAQIPYQTQPYALVLSLGGSWFNNGGKTIFDAITASFDACTKAFPNNVCVLYSINNKVVMSQ